ncbi:MAG: hypothetical protein J6I31_08760 [Prevotella sp.]|nr:hypothetical protein [Prevotella sp.]
MKRAVRFIVILALLMVVQLASAQSGKISYGDLEMAYSYSSAKNVKVEWPEGWTAGRFYEGYTTYKSPVEFATITCDASVGEEITVTARKTKGTNNDRVGGCVLFDGQRHKVAEDAKGIKLTFKVPSENMAKKIKVQLWCGDPNSFVVLYEIIWKVKGEATTPTPVKPEKKDTCRMKKSKYEFFDLWGEVSIRCNDEEDDAYEFARLDDPIYENDRIRTKEESGAVLVWELEDHENPYHDQTFTMGEESIIVIPIKPRDPCDIRNYEDGRINWGYVAGKMWAIEKHNFKRMLEGREPEDPCEEKGHIVFGVRDLDELPPDFDEEKIRKHWMELSGEQVYEIRQQIRWWNDHNNPAFRKKGTTTEIPVVYAIESQGSEVKINMLSGFVPVVSEKTKAFYILKEGQSATVGRNGKIVVKKIDVNKVAKKFGISNAALQGNTETVVKRYEIERAIVKYKVTKGNRQGVLAKAFDKYGRYERRELKIGNVNSIALTQGSNSYALDKKTKIAKRTKDADLNFLNLNEALMKKLNLKKKGTAKVVGKKCDHYVGRNVEYYVWKGLVIKKVQKEKDGTTTIHEVTSIEEPTSIDAKMFKMPKGYTVK